MIRQIIHIDEEKCSGCGLCAKACHEGAIGIIGGKAKLLREDYCDGMGDCLPGCPEGAISFENREAPAYDEAAVAEIKKRKELMAKIKTAQSSAAEKPVNISGSDISGLRNWPVQIKLAPLSAAYYDGAHILIAADCTAYAYASFHEDFMKGKVTLIGCTKLDSTDYSEKLTAIFSANNIARITVARMQVPCCGGIEKAVNKAVIACGKEIPVEVSIISSDGKILG